MASRSDVNYPFKDVAEVFEPDNSYQTGSLEQRHRALSRADLHLGVPKEVREVFDTARNISLYAQFAYRFHQPAELVGYSALEMALRQVAEKRRPDLFKNRKGRDRDPGLYDLMCAAIDDGWLREDGYRCRRARARRAAEHRRSMEAMETMRRLGVDEISYEDPSDAEVEAELANVSVLNAIRETTHKLRNVLAHGSSNLHPSSIDSLTLLADTINQLFPRPDSEGPTSTPN